LLGNGFPVNGYDFGHGIQFPFAPATDDFFLRTDYLPNRLYRFDGTVSAWIAVEDAVRTNMTNNNFRNTQKTGFINNDAFIYNDMVASDYKKLTLGDIVIPTQIPFTTTASFVVIKLETEKSLLNLFQYEVSKQPGLLTSYQYTNTMGVQSSAIQINLPIIDTVQQSIPYTGQGTVTLYNNREAQKQSLSKALKPRADL